MSPSPSEASGIPMWAGVDSAWEQEKLEARKTFENAAESPPSGAHFVGLKGLEDTAVP